MPSSYACVVLLFYLQHVRKIRNAFVRIRNRFARILKHFSSIHKVSFFFLTNHIIFGDFSANFKCVSVFHIRKDIRPGIRAALGYSPKHAKCKSSITNLRNIFQISQNLVSGRENAYEYQRMPGDHHCDQLANYRGDM